MNLDYHAKRTYSRLLPSLEAHFKAYAARHPADWGEFTDRLHTHFPALFKTLFPVYGNVYDFFYYLERLFNAMGEAWSARPQDLKELDLEREKEPNWYQSNQIVGGICYVDKFAGDLKILGTKIPYFKELGLTYLHLMPLFYSPSGENDGGYAISSYHRVDPALGTIDQLPALAGKLRRNGISLVLDFVFNHTSNEHEWAMKARAGDSEYKQYYFMFPDRELPDAYEKNLREIFPGEHPGAFTYFADIKEWVWTTFHSYQWDLNYQNPAVFVSMAEEMLFLANLGVEVLRLDALAFIWKKMGTNCENLPEAHLLVQAFNIIARIAAPALVFKSEAIVHPDEVIRYISPGECQISYNPLLMALLWESLATRKVTILNQALQERFAIPQNCAWVNYVRCHDDIGWTFSDEDAARLGINGYDHRQFLNAFYTGRFPGSFGRGLPFQENPKTGDCRISGTCASLAGLEKAIHEETSQEVELAIKRILLLHGIILTIGGIPLIYLGDEIATLNDYAFREDPSKDNDSRWTHRPVFDWQRARRRRSTHTLEGRVYLQIRHLIEIRKQHTAFAGQNLQVLQTDNPHVLGYSHEHAGERLFLFANFSEDEQSIAADRLCNCDSSKRYRDLITGDSTSLSDLHLKSYQVTCIQVE